MFLGKTKILPLLENIHKVCLEFDEKPTNFLLNKQKKKSTTFITLKYRQYYILIDHYHFYEKCTLKKVPSSAILGAGPKHAGLSVDK